MTNKPNKTKEFTATHENGKTWRLAVSAKKGQDFANEQAKNFARNYCRKHRIPGVVALVSSIDGREVIARVAADYTV